MAYVHIRIDDDFYKATQAVLETKLETDISTFIRDVLRDAILIYADDAEKEAAFAALGRKHEAHGSPSLIVDMAEDWAEKKLPAMVFQLKTLKRGWSLANKAKSSRVPEKLRKITDSKPRG